MLKVQHCYPDKSFYRDLVVIKNKKNVVIPENLFILFILMYLYDSVANMELCLVSQPLNLIVFFTDGKSVKSNKPIINDH